MSGASEIWPAIAYAEWKDTCATLHMWTQVVGKVRMARTPLANHWWNVTLYVTSRGLTTGPIPDGVRSFQVDFDLVDHRLAIAVSDGQSRSFKLEPRSVADFYREVMRSLGELGIEVSISTRPQEVADPIPFEQDSRHAYDPVAANRFFRALVQADRVFTLFRSRFLGKSSPVHFFWGSFDLAVTRFSGRSAPRRPGVPTVAEAVMREAYSHEVSSAGFWPGGSGADDACFYTYAYPEPEGFRHARVRPTEVSYHADLGQFLLPYEVVRRAPDPDGLLLDCLQTTYEAAADLGGWDRAALEREG
jgi:hypothetical protein